VGYRLGVDLGTTYTAAAVNVDGRAEMLGLGIRAMQVPSVLFVRDDGEIVVGEAAEQQGAADSDRVVREFKRRIGDSVPLIIGASPYSAQALTARLLAWVVGIATERQGGPPDHVCVTHPANWGPFKRDLLVQAIEMAGLRDVETSTRTEPEAAAIAYASRDRVAEGDQVAVYDLGGGTFDAAVLVREGAGFRLAGPPDGVEHLGGIDFDEAVFQHVLAALGDDATDLDDSDQATVTALARLRRDCVEAKEVLSFSTDTVIPVALPGINRSLRLTRGELDDMLRPAVGETVAAMRRVLTSAGVEPADLSAIVMVGGSSRIPMVSELLSGEFGRPLALDNHPKHDVALGVASRATPISEPEPTDGAGAARIPEGPETTTAADETALSPAVTAADEPHVPAGPSPEWRPPAVVAPQHVGRPLDRANAPATERRRRRLAPSLLLVTLLMIAAGSVVIVSAPSAETVHREAINSDGAFPPFVPANGSQGVPEVSVPVMNTAAVTGDTPGLYGGTRSDTCNAQGIRTYLEANPDKAGAWATAMDLPPTQVGPFLGSLTPVTLRTDTAVTNHGFRDGSATAFQSVLQAGTGVLVDAEGLPRVRCYCGNPLGEPDQPTSAAYTGVSWNGFSKSSVTVITKAPKEVTEFVVVDPGTDEVVTRPRGTSGKNDRPTDPGIAQNVRKRTLHARPGGGSATGVVPSTAVGGDGQAVGGTRDQNTVAPGGGEQPDASTAAGPGGGQSPDTSTAGTRTPSETGTDPGTRTEPDTGIEPGTGPGTGTVPDVRDVPGPAAAVEPAPATVVDAVSRPTGQIHN
jgi:actin-like ATPase involved in cell morphogenesis